MSKTQITILIVFLLIFLIITGVIVAQLGGSSIRTSGQVQVGDLILPAGPIIPGVPIKIAYELSSTDDLSADTLLLLRTTTGTFSIARFTPSQISDQSFTANVPCRSEILSGANQANMRFLLVKSSDQSLLAQSRLFELLPPGPDCFFRK